MLYPTLSLHKQPQPFVFVFVRRFQQHPFQIPPSAGVRRESVSQLVFFITQHTCPRVTWFCVETYKTRQISRGHDCFSSENRLFQRVRGERRAHATTSSQELHLALNSGSLRIPPPPPTPSEERTVDKSLPPEYTYPGDASIGERTAKTYAQTEPIAAAGHMSVHPN